MVYLRSDLLHMINNHSVSVKIDLGCGARKRVDYIGVDAVALPGVDIICDIDQGLPFADDAIDEVHACYVLEHVKNIVFVMKELYRVCRDKATVEIKVPYYQSVTQYKDPTHQSFLVPEMLRYFAKDDWYGSDYGINTNFIVHDIAYHYLPPFDSLMSKRFILFRPVIYPMVFFARRFLWNVVHSITLKLEVIKE